MVTFFLFVWSQFFLFGQHHTLLFEIQNFPCIFRELSMKSHLSEWHLILSHLLLLGISGSVSHGTVAIYRAKTLVLVSEIGIEECQILKSLSLRHFSLCERSGISSIYNAIHNEFWRTTTVCTREISRKITWPRRRLFSFAWLVHWELCGSLYSTVW